MDMPRRCQSELTLVEQMLERMAAAGETDARPLLARAQRIRARLHAA
jgi:hypothetical protein